MVTIDALLSSVRSFVTPTVYKSSSMQTDHRQRRRCYRRRMLLVGAVNAVTGRCSAPSTSVPGQGQGLQLWGYALKTMFGVKVRL